MSNKARNITLAVALVGLGTTITYMILPDSKQEAFKQFFHNLSRNAGETFNPSPRVNLVEAYELSPEHVYGLIDIINDVAERFDIPAFASTDSSRIEGSYAIAHNDPSFCRGKSYLEVMKGVNGNEENRLHFRIEDILSGTSIHVLLSDAAGYSNPFTDRIYDALVIEIRNPQVQLPVSLAIFYPHQIEFGPRDFLGTFQAGSQRRDLTSADSPLVQSVLSEQGKQLVGLARDVSAVKRFSYVDVMF